MKSKILIAVISMFPFLCVAQNQDTKPILKIGSGTHRIWSPDFRNVETVSAVMSDMSNADYNIKEFTVTVLSDQTKTYKTVKNTGNKLNDEIKSLFSSLKSNDAIVIDGIIVTEPLGKTINLDDQFYRVR